MIRKMVVPEINMSIAPPAPESARIVVPAPVRVLVHEVPAPGQTPELGDASFDDARSIAAAKKSRPGGYLRLPLEAVNAIGRRVVLLSKALVGTDLVLRVRLVEVPAYVRR
jgi:hypothetical protein